MPNITRFWSRPGGDRGDSFADLHAAKSLMSSDVDDIKEQLGSLNTTVSELDNSVKETKSRVEKSLATFGNSISENANEIREINTKLTPLISEQDRLKTLYDDSIFTLNMRNAEVKVALEDYEQSNNEAIKNLQGSLNAYEQTMNNFKAEQRQNTRNLSDKITAVETNVAGISAKIPNLESIVANLPARMQVEEEKAIGSAEMAARLSKIETDARGFMDEKITTASRHSKDIEDLKRKHADLKTTVENIDITQLEKRMETYINAAVDRVKADRVSSGLRAYGLAIEKINEDIKAIKLKLNIP